MLINLISNSFKFTEHGRIEVKIRTFKRDRDDFLKFEVFDTGVGISKQDIPKLFKMFGMLSQHRNQMNQAGTGLGLSISKRIVESLGGKIYVKSQENEWTKFTFTIMHKKPEDKLFEEIKEVQSPIINSEDSKQSHEEVKVSHISY